MKKLILILALALLLCSCVDGATKIGLDRLNWSQSIDGIKFSGTAPASTTGVLYNDSGTLKFNGTDVSLGGGGTYYATVGATDDCDYITDGIADEVQLNTALAENRYVRTIGNLHIAASVTPVANNVLVVGGTISRGNLNDELIYSTADDISIIGDGGTLEGNSSTNSNLKSIIRLTGNNLTIRDITVQNTYYYGIELSSTRNTSVINCRVFNCTNATTKYATGGGIIVYDNSSDILIQGNRISKAGWMGISVAGDTSNSEWVRIIGNDVSYVYSNFGIGVAGNSSRPSSNVVVKGNNVRRTCRENINFYNVYFSTIADNTCAYATTDYGICCWECIGNSITGNTVSYSYKSGIALDSCYACTVNGNSIIDAVTGGSGTGTYGIHVKAAAGKTASYNSVSGNTVIDFNEPRNAMYCMGETTGGGTVNSNQFVGNVLGGYLTGAISTVGDATVNQHNLDAFE